MKRVVALSLGIASITYSLIAGSFPEIEKRDSVVSLGNNEVRLAFDLSRGSYTIYKQSDPRPVISEASLRINQWSSTTAGLQASWSRRVVRDALGEGLALDLSFEKEGAPELLFSFVLYEGENFFSASAGVRNSTGDSLRVKEIYVLADAEIYAGYDLSHDFAMVDGFSGGEPRVWGTPLLSADAGQRP